MMPMKMTFGIKILVVPLMTVQVLQAKVNLILAIVALEVEVREMEAQSKVIDIEALSLSFK